MESLDLNVVVIVAIVIGISLIVTIIFNVPIKTVVASLITDEDRIKYTCKLPLKASLLSNSTEIRCNIADFYSDTGQPLSECTCAANIQLNNSITNKIDIIINLKSKNLRIETPIGVRLKAVPDGKCRVINHTSINIVVTTFVVLLLAGGTYSFVSRYQDKVADSQQNFLNNLRAVTCNVKEPDGLTIGASDLTEDSQFYSTVPDINLVVITKPDNVFVPQGEDSEFFNPVEVNTVLMFYEDNKSGKKNVEASKATLGDSSSVTTSYYDITELYLATPIVIDNKSYTLGAVLQGDVKYEGYSGYEALRLIFAKEYHINMVSVTEIPESLFEKLYTEEVPFPVNISRDYLITLLSNYDVDSSWTGASSPSISSVISEEAPKYNELFQRRLREAKTKLQLNDGASNDAPQSTDLLLDGESIVAFGNSLRLVGTDSEDDWVSDNRSSTTVDNELDPTSDFTGQINNIAHSNWDIVLAYFLESLSNMSNNSYEVFCKQDQTSVVNSVRSTLSKKELQGFLETVMRANTTLGEEAVPSHQFVFTVRNLNYSRKTNYGSTNVYLLNKPLEGFYTNFTNVSIKKYLYFCLEYSRAW